MNLVLEGCKKKATQLGLDLSGTMGSGNYLYFFLALHFLEILFKACSLAQGSYTTNSSRGKAPPAFKINNLSVR